MKPNPHPTTSRRRWIVVACAAAALAAVVAAWWLWRERAVQALLAEAVPARPSLDGQPAELRHRIESTEARVERGPDREEALAELSRLYHANGFLPQAAACYELLLTLEPRNPRWPHRLATILAGYGRLDEALPLLQRTVELAPDHLPARLHLADAWRKLDRSGDAAREYRVGLAQDPGNPFARTGLARTAIESGEWIRAREALEAALRDRPQFEPAWHWLATVCERLGDTAAASRARARGTASDPEIPDPWLDELMDDCYDAYRLSVVAAIAENGGDLDRADRLLRRAIALDAGNGSILVQHGKLLAQRGDADGARAAFQRSVSAAPQHADGWLSLAILLAARGEQAAAERALMTGLRHNPDSSDLHLANGRRLANAGRFEAAAAAFRRTTELRPDDAQACLELAQALGQLERGDEALSWVQRAVAVQPGHPEALAILARHAIVTRDEAAARERLRGLRNHPRVPPATVRTLARQFEQEFGHAP